MNLIIGLGWFEKFAFELQVYLYNFALVSG